MENQKEIWKTIDGYENYQVSNFGNVKNLKTNRLLKKQYSKGYFRVRLYNKINNKKFSVHRLVAINFISNPYNKPQVNHINGIKSDNKIENLEWNTSKENINHSFFNKLQKPIFGESYKSKLKEKEVLEIRKSNLKLIELSQIYNVSFSLISMIKNKKIWKHL